MKITSLFYFVLILFSARSVQAAMAPESVKTNAFSIAPKVEELVQPIKVEDLARDDFFLDTLKKILKRPDFEEADKAATFYLMLKEIRWNFSGLVHIPKGYDYFQTFSGYAGTFFQYQNDLEPLQYDV